MKRKLFLGMGIGMIAIAITVLAVQYANPEENKSFPPCEELNIPQEQIDATIDDAVIGIENPWGNEKDFQLLVERIQGKLGCTIRITKDTTKTKDDGKRNGHNSPFEN